MKYLLSVLSLCTVGLLATSCNEDDENPNNRDTGQVAFTMEGVNGSSSSGRTLANMEITSATAAVTKVELDADDDMNEGDDIDGEVEFEGEYTVDLLTGTSDPAFGVVEAEAATYDQVDIEFGTFLENDASILIKGTYTNNDGETVPFTYAYNDDFDIEMESNAGFDVSVGEVKEITASLDFSIFFEDIDFGLAEMNDDEIVVINADLNTYVYNLINQNFDAAIAIEIEED